MVNINGKPWDKLDCSDVIEHLKNAENESLFFEYKQDDEKPKGIAKEISALANTYGGYIFIGISDNKDIFGCRLWDENKVHTTVYGSISPVPAVDVKTIVCEGKKIVIIRVEEGHFPPYITNKGFVYERVSSGSYPIKESGKLSQLYYKRNDQLKRIKTKIELDSISDIRPQANNLCGCIDIGFALICNGPTEIQENFYRKNMKTVADRLKQLQENFAISRIGYSYFISVGKVTYNASNGDEIPASAGMHNYIEIMPDGSARMRILLTSSHYGNKTVDIRGIVSILGLFKEAYTLIIGNLENIFVEAYKYQQLQVIKQFTPEFIFKEGPKSDTIVAFRNYLGQHKEQYGDNIIINGNRMPVNDYQIIDRHYFDTYEIEYSNGNLIEELFSCHYINMGYIDPPAI